MASEVNELVTLFLDILRMFSIIEKKPWYTGTGSKVYLAEIQTLSMIAENPNVNLSQLAMSMGITRGAISQTVRKLLAKKLVIRSNSPNQKEVNLSLTESGIKVSDAYQARMREIFAFASNLHDTATDAERDLVRRLFVLIQSNMKNRI